MAALQIIPTNEASIFDVLRRLSTSQQQLALVRPNNPPPGIAGFIFDIVGDEAVELFTDTSDHYLEDNTAIQDQAALRPERVTVKGLVAELVFEQPKEEDVNPSTEALPPNPAFEPEFSPGAEQILAQNEVQSAAEENAIESGQSLYGEYAQRASPNQTRQASAFGYFYQLWKGRQLFTVETPWGVFTDMILENGRSEQLEDTKWRTDLTLVFKKMRLAQSASVNVGQIAGRAAFQRAPVSQNGTAGVPTATPQQEESLLHMITPKAFLPSP